jgi:hypothetical protein
VQWKEKTDSILLDGRTGDGGRLIFTLSCGAAGGGNGLIYVWWEGRGSAVVSSLGVGRTSGKFRENSSVVGDVINGLLESLGS